VRMINGGIRMKVPLAQPIMTEKMIEAASNALRNERLTMGESMIRFEEDFARMCGVKHAVSVNSGTAAIQLSLLAAGVKAGDVVTTSSMSFVATTNAYVAFGGVPAFADVLEGEYTLDPEKIALGPEVKAIVPVHLYGHPSRMDEIVDLARDKGVLVVEDACQAHGAKYKGRRAGALGDIGCFSFYPTKNMHVGGDGGMVTTDDADVAEMVKKLRHCGRKGQYEHDVIGYTARLNSANAAVGIEQLKSLDAWNERRRGREEIPRVAQGRRWTAPPTPAERGHRPRLSSLHSPHRPEEPAEKAPRRCGRSDRRPLRDTHPSAADIQGDVRLRRGNAAVDRTALQGGRDSADVPGHDRRADRLCLREDQGILRIG
jgi:dTDP-4-amino-4,6-dideoxygalactose transaminase